MQDRRLARETQRAYRRKTTITMLHRETIITDQPPPKSSRVGGDPVGSTEEAAPDYMGKGHTLKTTITMGGSTAPRARVAGLPCCDSLHEMILNEIFVCKNIFSTSLPMIRVVSRSLIGQP